MKTPRRVMPANMVPKDFIGVSPMQGPAKSVEEMREDVIAGRINDAAIAYRYTNVIIKGSHDFHISVIRTILALYNISQEDLLDYLSATYLLNVNIINKEV